MNEFVNTIDSLGDDVVTNSIIDGSITEIKDDVLTTVGSYAFYERDSLVTLDLPSVTSIKAYGIYDCEVLKTVNLPNCKSFGSYVLYNNTSSSGGAEKIILPKLETIGPRCFNMLGSLKMVDFSCLKEIPSYSFLSCNMLIAMVMRSETLCVRRDNNSLTGKFINDGSCRFYVPRALVESYKTAANWSKFANQFRPLEDYTLDGTISGELNETKLNLRQPVEIEDDWSTIMEAVNDGTYAGKYSIGDWKPLDLGSEGLVNMQIVAKDTEELGDGSGTAALSWLSINLLDTPRRMNPALITNYVDRETEGWRRNSNEWRSCLRRHISEASLKLVLTARQACTLKISYSCGYTVLNNYVGFTLSVNDTAIDLNNKGSGTPYSASVEVGDVITIDAVASHNHAGSTTNVTLTIPGASTYFDIAETIGMIYAEVFVGHVEGTGMIGGWEKTELRSYLKDSIKPLIPTEISSNIVEVVKTQPAFDTTGADFSQTTIDDVWLPSEAEITGKYALCYMDANNRIKNNQSGTASRWVLRSASSHSSPDSYNSTGTSSTAASTTDYYIALGFCTGVTK